jgi:hypothetical protein
MPASPDRGQSSSSVTPEEAARRAAAARAYALSSTPSTCVNTAKDVTPQQRPKQDTWNGSPCSNNNNNNSHNNSHNNNNPYLPPRSKTPTRDSSKSGKTLLAKNHTLSINDVTVSAKHRLEELDQVGDEDYANFMRSLLMDDDDLDGQLSEREMDTEDDEDYQCEEEQGHDDDDDDDDDDDEEEEEGGGGGGEECDQEQEGTVERRKLGDNVEESCHDVGYDRIDIHSSDNQSRHHNDNNNNHHHHHDYNDDDDDDESPTKDFLKPIQLDETDLFLDPIALEEELGSLLEEDMEAAVNSLLQQQPDVHHVSSHAGGLGVNNNMSGGMRKENAVSLYSTSEVDGSKDSLSRRSPKESMKESSGNSWMKSETSARTKAFQAASKFPMPNQDQIFQLKKLMNQHYQILLQQATLAVRAAHGNKFKVSSNRGSNKRKRVESFFCCGETADDLAGILDGAVTMLQDLDKHRKDAIRYSIQMRRVRAKKNPRIERGGMIGDSRIGNEHHYYSASSVPSAARAILGDDEYDSIIQDEGILTRSAFSRTLKESDWMWDVHTNSSFGMSGGNDQRTLTDPCAATIFGVRGLARLNETFSAIDNSISAYSDQTGLESGHVPMRPINNRMGSDVDNIFCEPDHGRACEMLLHHARAEYDRNLIPGYRDLTHVLTYPCEIMGNDIGVPMSKEQQKLLRQNKLQFTAAEDNLLLRGVVSDDKTCVYDESRTLYSNCCRFLQPSHLQNLYGEKEWVFISDRFLPDRSVSVIAQRYWRLCLLIYKGHGVQIDPNGKLQERNLPNGIEDLDERAVQRALKPVKKPTVYGLYRWTMEEDLLLLKAVPIMGRMFAEIGKRFIPYRDRGALRKRYQVLERRVKGAMKRDKKAAIESKKRGNAIQKNQKTTSLDYQNDPHQFYPKNPATNVAQPYVSSGFYPRPIANNNASGLNSMNNNNVTYHSTHPSSIPTQPPVPPPVPKGSSDSYSAFGRVIEGEWSQFSKTVEEIIDENASKLLNIGHSQTAMHQASQYLPNIDYNNDSLSGLSALAATESNLGNFKKGDSIMKLVMHQSSDPEAFQKAKGLDQDIFKKDDHSKSRRVFPGDDPNEFDHDLSFQRNLPPLSSQINSNLSFLGGGLTMSQNLDHSLMAPPEFDAVSALNQMSNSGSIGFNPPNSYQKDNMKKENLSSKKTSFFEKVVGSNNKK